MKDRLNLNELAEVVNDEKHFTQLLLLITTFLVIGSCTLGFLSLGMLSSGTNTLTFRLALIPHIMTLLIVIFGLSALNYFAYRRAMKRVKETTHFELPNRSLQIILATVWEVILGGIVLTILIVLLKSFIPAVLIFLLWLARHHIVTMWASRPFQRGNMEGAYKRLQLLKKIYRKNPLLAAIEAAIFIQQGKLKEGELAYRDALARAQLTANTLVISVALNDLGYFFVFIERYEESLPLLEMGLRISPQLSPIYDSLALYYVEQNIYPERAIELTERALEYHKDKLGRNIMIATMARALAQMGIQDEANTKLNEAIESAEKLNNKLALAEIFRQAGHIRLLQGDVENANGEKKTETNRVE